jgi:hypothetical protein
LIILDFVDGLHIFGVFGWLGIGVALDAIGIRPRIDGARGDCAAEQEKPNG